ncbi:hypothetical protein B0O80DRAFT_421896 [Mortierella sp. GBAus27b]|nr:hypothetical protein B0O80DRAFT_421896 [Mortierella sp. GBAus27b]
MRKYNNNTGNDRRHVPVGCVEPSAVHMPWKTTHPRGSATRERRPILNDTFFQDAWNRRHGATLDKDPFPGPGLAIKLQSLPYPAPATSPFVSRLVPTLSAFVPLFKSAVAEGLFSFSSLGSSLPVDFDHGLLMPILPPLVKKTTPMECCTTAFRFGLCSNTERSRLTE